MISSRSLIDYLTHLFCRMGCPYGDANVVSEVLVEAELRGEKGLGLSAQRLTFTRVGIEGAG